MVSGILAIVFIGATIVQLLFWLLVFARLGTYASIPPLGELNLSDDQLPPISVVICGCNEADNLSKYLDRFLAQDYPFFEVVVVNDNSVDETEKILLAFQKKYSILHPVTITEQHPPGKKHAL
jgi:cellulose synthase/poly-beta-1,6-N-acetylglucosamine synthase-like glycosyltransferase